MATVTDITSGVQTCTTTGAVTPTTGLDVSAVTGDWTVETEIIAMTSGKTAKIYIEESVNAFTASQVLAVLDIGGKFAGEYSFKTPYAPLRKYALPHNQFGLTSAVVRYNVAAIDSGSTLKLHGWLSQ